MEKKNLGHPAEPDPMQCSEWVMVGDSKVAPELTAKQYSLLESRECRPRVIDCSNPEMSESQPCRALPAFPAMCHIPSSSCAAGLHQTDADFEELKRMSMGGS